MAPAGLIELDEDGAESLEFAPHSWFFSFFANNHFKFSDKCDKYRIITADENPSFFYKHFSKRICLPTQPVSAAISSK